MKDLLDNPEHPEGLTETQERLALSLYNAGVVLFDFERGFRMKIHDTNPDLPRSPLYINLRDLQSFPETMDEAVFAMIEQAEKLEFDRVAGVPHAAIPLASLMANKMRKPQITPRMDVKAHGLGREIDGKYVPGDLVLVVDDLVTTGGSKFEVIERLRTNGLIVRDVVVVFNREQKAERWLMDKGLVLHAALKIKPTLQFYARGGRINQEQLNRVLDYLQNPLVSGGQKL